MDHAGDGLTQPIIDPVTGAYSRALLQRRLDGELARDGRTALLEAADRRNYLAKRRGRGGAVADDADTGNGGSGPSRLWERDAAMAVVHDYLTRLQSGETGALRVSGEPGAGHTRFLAE